MTIETEEILDEQILEEQEFEEMPSLNHSYLSWQISQQLSENKEIAPLPELTLNIGKGIVPDFSVYPLDKINPDFWHDVVKFPEVPVLAIEIVSPNQSVNILIEKADLLIENGVKTVWVIEPITKSIVVVSKNDKQLFQNQEVESEGIKVDFRKIFGNG